MSRRRAERSGNAVRALLRGVAVATLAGTLSACVAPALDSGAYERNAIQALDSGVSDTRTGAMALQNLLARRIPRPYGDTVVTDSEKSLGPVEDSFGAVDPPSPADERLRDVVVALLSDAGDALAEARIAVRHDDRADMATSMNTLRVLANRMELLSERLS